MQLKEDLEALGHRVFYFNVDHSGNFNSEDLIEKINLEKNSSHEVLINFTYINNETGVVWPLSLAEKIKRETNAIVHVDAVQLVGKISDWNQISTKLDAYTLSGHKFGAMKGVGFSFVKKNVQFSPLLVGGSQQDNLRAGTENAIGIYSLKLALLDIVENFNANELSVAKNMIEQKIIECVGTSGEVVARKSDSRNLTTIFLVLHGQKAEVLSAKFDMLGVDLSTGSACSSGVIKENRILMNMGYSFEDSRSTLRFSFSPLMKKSEAEKYSEKIVSVLKTIL